MVEKSWVHLCRVDPAYERGASKFVQDVSASLGGIDVIVCPCIDCRNVDRQTCSEVVVHLVTRGMDSSYKSRNDGYHHGETDPLTEYVNDVGNWNAEVVDLYRAAKFVEMAEVEDKKEDDFLKKLADAEKPLYPSCVNHSKLSAIVSLIRLKTQNGWSDKSFSDLLDCLPDMLPEDNELHTSLYEVKKFLRMFDMRYEKIHACVNDCCLFRKKYKKLDECPKCKASRWKINPHTGEAKKNVPMKVLRYFPIIPRLKRMFRCEVKLENPQLEKRLQPKCVLFDWGGNEIGPEGRFISADPEVLVSDIPLGPNAVQVLIESVTKQDAFLWRPTSEISTVGQAAGEMVAWPETKCDIAEIDLHSEDVVPRSPSTALNRCKLLQWNSTNDLVVAEGRWQCKEPGALVGGLPLGPNAVKVFVDMVIEPDLFLWRPTKEMRYLKNDVLSSVAWPISRVVFLETTDTTVQGSPSFVRSAASGSKATQLQFTPTENTQDSVGKSSKANSPQINKETTSKPKKSLPKSPLRRSQRSAETPKPNQKCNLMDLSGNKQVVAEGHWVTNDPNNKVHFVRLGPDGCKVWVDVVKVDTAIVWRPNDEIEVLGDALGLCIAWPEDKVVML